MKLTKARRQVLSEVDDAAQSFRIARRLEISTTSAQSALQWLRRNDLCEFSGSRWNLTPAGREAAAALKEKADG